jgi:hypothetical protein
MKAMNLRGKISVSIITVIVVFIIGFIVGAALLTGYVGYLESSSVPDEVSAPTWGKGQYWTYSFKTPEIEDVVSRIVVAGVSDENYDVGVASRIDAQRHGVLNFNPMLGRISVEELSVFEKGAPQPLFSFPLKENKQWQFSMFDVNDFKAKVLSIRKIDMPSSGETILVEITAVAPGGETLEYTYDRSAEWINSLVLKDTSGNEMLEMNLISHGSGFAGSVYFVRGVDLMKHEYSSPVVDVQNTLIEGHPEWGSFDQIIYHFEVLTEANSGGTLVIKDPTTTTEAMRRVFGPNTFESSLGTIPSDSEQLSVSIALTGDSFLKLRIAGGIEYSWVV